MPELRKDPVVGRWVIIAKERARRPGNFIDSSDVEPDKKARGCIFCHPSQEPIHRDVYKPSGRREALCGDVVVVPSPMSDSRQGEMIQRKKNGIYDVINAEGKHEIVIETQKHCDNMADLPISQIERVIRTYASRLRALCAMNQYQYVLAYKNFGRTAGSRNIGHTRSHIVATPVRPIRVKEKLIGAKQYYDANKQCIYCDYIHQDIKEGERVIEQTRHFIAMIPFAARFLFEVWIFPKDHHCDFHIGIDGKERDLAVMMKKLLKKYQLGLENPAYNFVIQTAPLRQSVSDTHKWVTIETDYHWHIELMPRLTRIAGFEKGTGFYICSIPPEDMAEYLRSITHDTLT